MRFVLFVVLLMLAGAAQAQEPVTIEGRVVDAQTGEPLEAASLLVEGTGRGTITNAEGRYALRVEALPARVLVRYLGYQAATFEVRAGQQVYDVQLEPSALSLAGVEVRAEDPGMRIMRLVIEEKQRWRADLSSYAADAYTRLVIRNDTGIVQVEEILTDVFWRREGGFREIVRGRRKSANSQVGDLVPAAALIVNLYNDDIEIAGFRFVGVTHPRALDVYRFRLRGTREEGGRRIYDIAVEPRSDLAVAFVGRVAVLDSAFALLEAELTPGPAFRFPAPIQRYEVTYAQQFHNFGTRAWLPIDFRARSTVEVGMPGLLRFPPLDVEQISRVSDYAVNVPVPDSLYDEMRSVAVVDSAAVEADTLLDRAGVRVPLAEEERAAVAAIDSTQTLDKTFEPSGPMARFVRITLGEGQAGRPVTFGFSPRLWYNRVEALHAGAEARVSVRGVGRLAVEAGYETARQDVRYAVSARVGRRVYVEGGYDHGVARRYDSAVETPFLNSFNVLLNRGDYFDYTDRERAWGAIGWRPRGRDLDVQIGFTSEAHEAVEAITELWTARGERTPRANPDLAAGRFHALTAAAMWGGDLGGLGIIPQQRLHVGFEQSLESQGEAFGRVHGTLDFGFETFARRRFLPARLDLRLTGQHGWGRVPRVRYGFVEASNRFTTPFGTLRTLQPLPYLGRSSVALHWEHNFRSIPFERMGWEWAARRNYSVIVHGGHARTWAPAADLRRAPRSGHHEVGASLSGLFTYFRLDFTARLDAPAFTVGIAPARLF